MSLLVQDSYRREIHRPSFVCRGHDKDITCRGPSVPLLLPPYADHLAAGSCPPEASPAAAAESLRASRLSAARDSSTPSRAAYGVCKLILPSSTF
jgi:hypothetical protein